MHGLFRTIGKSIFWYGGSTATGFRHACGIECLSKVVLLWNQRPRVDVIQLDAN